MSMHRSCDQSKYKKPNFERKIELGGCVGAPTTCRDSKAGVTVME